MLFSRIYAYLRLFTGLLLYNTVVANGEYHYIAFAMVVNARNDVLQRFMGPSGKSVTVSNNWVRSHFLQSDCALA